MTPPGPIKPYLFVEKPRLAMVIAILICIVGLLSLEKLPVSQFPQVAPPIVRVDAVYPGANAETVADTIATVVEDAVNGVEDMMYMTSTARDNGQYSLEVVFEQGTDEDTALIRVLNDIQLVQSQLPAEVIEQGIEVQASGDAFLANIAFYSPEGSLSKVFINNYVDLNILPAIKRIKGIGSAEILGGGQYSMRIWTDPKAMFQRNISPEDIAEAIRKQNVQATGGKIGAAPIGSEQVFEYAVNGQGRFDSAEQFEKIIVNSDGGTGITRLGDVARVELNRSDFQATGRYMGRYESAGLRLAQTSTANAMAVMEAVRQELELAEAQFPDDLAYSMVYDATDFVEATISEIAFTLAITVLLVCLVTYGFMGDWRLALVPSLAIPVSLLGSLILIYSMGYSINTITLFAMVLAIGLVVDDAILVVENVQRLMSEEKLSAADAARYSMRQVRGPVISTTLVLLSVFVPFAFIPGTTGELYKQFAITLSSAVVVSSLVALSLSPALCSILLRNGVRSGPLLNTVNSGLMRARQHYLGLSGWFTRRPLFALFMLVPLALGAYYLYQERPRGFVPIEDQGTIFLDINLPDAAALPRTEKVTQRVADMLAEIPQIGDFIIVNGRSMTGGGSASNAALGIVRLTHWDARPEASQSAFAVVEELRSRFSLIREADINVILPPSIQGLGRVGGVNGHLLGSLGQDPQTMASSLRALMVAANEEPAIAEIFSKYTAEYPRLFLDIDRDRAEVLGVNVATIFATLQSQFSQRYVNDFNLYGKSYKVYMMADESYRSSTDAILNTYVRSATGAMVPLSALARIEKTVGPDKIERYNQTMSASFNTSPADGFSSGQVMAELQQLVEKLPAGFNLGWTGVSYEEQKADGQATAIFLLSLVFVLLFLVAQYESWLLPVAILLSVVVGAFGATVGVTLAGFDINIYVQIGMVMLIGLAAKNAILIVEFARDRRTNGLGIIEAANTAARQRFRAVVMTAFSFLLGVTPMILASGAGAISREMIGLTVFSGMLAASTIGIILVPAFYVLCQRIREAGHRGSVLPDITARES